MQFISNPLDGTGLVPVTDVSVLGRPKNRKVALLGDSRMRRHNSTSTGRLVYEAEGFLNWLRFLTRQSFYFDETLNFGVDGDNSQQVLARTDAALAATDAGTFVLLCSTNERVSQNFAFTHDAVASIIRKVRGAGRILIIIAELPKGESAMTGNQIPTAAQREIHQQVRQWYMKQGYTAGIYVVDPWINLSDPSTTNGWFNAGNTSDGVHPVALGGYNIARSCLSLFQNLFPWQYYTPQNNIDIYDATNNPYGCLQTTTSTNPMFIGTGGTVGTGGSGTLATGWTGANSSGATAVTRTYSQVTDAAGLGWQQCVLGGTPLGSSPTATLWRAGGLLLDASSNPQQVAGQTLEAFAEAQWDSDLANAYSVQLRVRYVDSGGTTQFDWIDMDGYDETALLPSGAFSGIMRIPHIVVPSLVGITDCFLEMRAQLKQSVLAGGTIRVRAMGLRNPIAA